MANNEVDVKAVITADDQASTVMNNFGSNTQKAMNVIAGATAVAGAALTLYTKNAVDYTKNFTQSTVELGRETGLTAEKASALLYVTQRMGISADQTQQMFGLFAKQIELTATASDKSTTALGRMGISVVGANGQTKDFNTILLETADAFQKMPDGTQKTADALAIFGRSGKDLIPVLNLGSQGIQDLEDKAQKLGLTLTTDNVASVEKYIQATKNLTDSQNALKIQIGQLTAPVLAAFENKLSQVLTTLLDSSGPFKGLAAATIAVGGPILSAGGAIVGFAANLEQARGVILAVGSALLAVAPELLIIGGLVAAGAVAFKLFHDNTQNAGQATDRAQDAQQKMNSSLQTQVTTLDDVNAAWKTYNRAQEDVTGAQLDVEQAQKDYNDAVAQYGTNSLQAREAAHQVAEAQYALQDATDKASTAQDGLNTAQSNMAVQAPNAVAAADIVATHISGITIAADNANTHVANLSLTVGQTLSQSLNAAQTIQGTFNNLQGAANTVQTAVNTAQQTANNLQTTISNLNTSGSKGITLNANTGGKSIPLRAEGGPVTAGQPYWVGEEGIPELFVPQQSGSIVPMDKMPSSSSGSPAPQAQKQDNTQVSITIKAGAFMGSQIDARKYAMQIFQSLQDIAASKNTTIGEMMTA